MIAFATCSFHAAREALHAKRIATARFYEPIERGVLDHRASANDWDPDCVRDLGTRRQFEREMDSALRVGSDAFEHDLHVRQSGHEE